MKVTPIFVVGSNRSGTTYISNILASSNLITAVQHEEHFGIHESSYFNHIYGRYGDIKNWSHYVEFIEATINSDYFRLTGVTREELYGLYPATYHSVFRFVMDRLATKENASYWIEKSPNHALELDLIAKCYPDALFISIKRNLKSVVRSSLGLKFKYNPSRVENKKYRLNSIKGVVFNYYRTYKSIASFSKRNSKKILNVNYEDLVANQEKTLDTVKHFININSDLVYSNQFSKNSSFNKSKVSESFFSKHELSKIKLHENVYKKMPLIFFVWKDRFKKYLMSKTTFFNKNRLPTWYYKTYEYSELKKKQLK